MKNWEEGVFEPDTEIDLDSNARAFCASIHETR